MNNQYKVTWYSSSKEVDRPFDTMTVHEDDLPIILRTYNYEPVETESMVYVLDEDLFLSVERV